MYQLNIAQRLPLALLVSDAMLRVQLLNNRGGLIHNHPIELMLGMCIFAMAVCLIVRAVDGVHFCPIVCRGTGGASDGVRQVIFPVT